MSTSPDTASERIPDDVQQAWDKAADKIAEALLEAATGKVLADRRAVLFKLANEYRRSMDKEVLHSWAGDVVKAIYEIPASPPIPQERQ